MSTNKQNKAKQNLLEQIEQLSKIDLKQQIQWLLVVGKSNFPQTGFVLPTTVMVLLVATLVVGALLVRSFSRTSQVISEREQKVIYNAATPAIDRAKAKMEYLFKQDNRLPSGVPSDAVLLSIMLNDGRNGIPRNLKAGVAFDQYTFPGETRLSIGNPSTTANAWAFKVDKDGDGTLDTTIAYSILSNTSKSTTTTTGTTTVGINSLEATKATNLIVRNGPIAGSQVANANCLSDSRTPEQGWYPITNTTLRKSFQIDAFVVNKNPANRTVTTLELQQDRQINRGSKWGAWFRNDLEIFPGPQFNFNGAMHTEGNLFVGGTQVTGYMLSSHNSCFYTQDGSEVSVGQSPTYEGQIVSGEINDNSFGGTSIFHLFNGFGAAPIKTTNTTLNTDTDSITPVTGQTPTTENIALDPIALFTSNVSQHRNLTTWLRDPNWKDRDFVTKGRILNDTSAQPFVDDTYRADNRYGPKPGYSPSQGIPTTNKIGDTIVASGTVTADDVTALTNDVSAAANSEAYGFDGYWERRARGNGLRLIVGQRLELGNTFDWGGANDPLNPPDTNITNERRQRRALRDNLAAVQATAVYHHEKNSGYFPIAFVATTVHPGTARSLSESKNFRTEDLISRLNVDFLGMTPIDINADGTADTTLSQGTNGWEFEVVSGTGETESAFATSIDDSTSPLRKALSNLARFAGDPDGAFPPKQELATAVTTAGALNTSKIVHPFPELAMWGNFSELRRVITALEGSATYSSLSIADKSTLHTAAGSLGMLAYNLKNSNDMYAAIGADTGAAGLNALGKKITRLMNGVASGTDPEIGTTPGTNICTSLGGATCPSTTYTPNYYSSFTAEQWINALKNSPGLGTDKPELVRRAFLIATRQQILRDRTFGFRPNTASFLPGLGTGYVATTGKYVVQNTVTGTFITATGVFNVSCDPNSFPVTGTGIEEARLGLTMAFCSRAEVAKYPSLFYLFPADAHSQSGSSGNIAPIPPDNTQPITEPYIGDLQNLNNAGGTTDNNPYIASVNGTYTYQKINTDINDFTGVILNPKNNTLTGGCTDDNWCLPTAASTTDTKENRITKPDTTLAVVPFLDTALSNGREMMNIRVLNIDLNILRRNLVALDTWLPSKDGIIYAFREDAVREDAIARPKSVTGDAAAAWTGYLSNSALAAYRMDVPTPKDPPVNSTNGISPKAVDYYADPDRRPYGFRLKNGQSVRRVSTGITAANNINGLSFVTDNAVYTQGDFNLHSTDETIDSLIEEFTQKLVADWSAAPEFYAGRTTIDTNFADPAQDTWRPTEILADAVTVISSAFNDGVVENAFTVARPGGASANNTSYQNQNRPTNLAPWGTNGYWLHEDPNYSANGVSPIKVDKNGTPLYCNVATVPCPIAPTNNVTSYTTPFSTFTNSGERRKDLNPPVSTRVNAIFVSGLIPSRAGQSNGGLHNFPRFLEHWQSPNGIPLYISGAFLQLNFSTSATAPFDQDAWEPTATTNLLTNEEIGYYDAPLRRWGYDVGLQYAPSGPAARRFITASNTRSEFYRELAVEDPYIKNLRCATYETVLIDTTATCP